MKRIVWADEARNDLRSNLAWIRQPSSAAALQAEIDILGIVVSAARRPLIGRSLPDLKIRLRSLPKWHRRIAYMVEGDEIIILSIKDPRQNLNL